MAITPFVFKKFRSELDINSIVQNINSVPHVHVSQQPATGKRPKFEVKVSDDRFMLRRPQGNGGFGKISMQPVVHGRLKQEDDTTRVHILIRPFYTDIIALLVMCSLQLYCTISSIAEGNYYVAAFAGLSIALAYVLVTIKFNAECRNYLALIQKVI